MSGPRESRFWGPEDEISLQIGPYAWKRKGYYNRQASPCATWYLSGVFVGGLGTVSRGKNRKDPSAQSCALHIGTGPIYVIRRARHTGTDMTHT